MVIGLNHLWEDWLHFLKRLSLCAGMLKQLFWEIIYLRVSQFETAIDRRMRQ
jgi:hypothetical protein